MNKMLTHSRVPAGSRLEIAVTSASQDFACNGAMSTYAQAHIDDQAWPQADLIPGPKVVPIAGVAEAYIVDVNLLFASAGPIVVEVTSRVFRANGELFGKIRSARIQGQNGDNPSAVTIVLERA